MKSLVEFARTLLEGTSLKDKLLPSSEVELQLSSPFRQYSLPTLPGRPSHLAFSEKQLKFPRVNALKDDTQRAVALHFFANHELLAIEMMAASILLWPIDSDEDFLFVKGMLHTIEDEQKHLSLYIQRMSELGLGFGDVPVNSFFWEQMSRIKSRQEFAAVMSLTFEAANLDFATYYRDIFNSLEDVKTANIMQVVLDDEISHVALGARYLDRVRVSRTEEVKLWEKYQGLLPWPLTPARSKGAKFYEAPRQRAGLPPEFIEAAKTYKDDYRVTQRKTWK